MVRAKSSDDQAGLLAHSRNNGSPPSIVPAAKGGTFTAACLASQPWYTGCCFLMLPVPQYKSGLARSRAVKPISMRRRMDAQHCVSAPASWVIGRPTHGHLQQYHQAISPTTERPPTIPCFERDTVGFRSHWRTWVRARTPLMLGQGPQGHPQLRGPPSQAQNPFSIGQISQPYAQTASPPSSDSWATGSQQQGHQQQLAPQLGSYQVC